MTLVKMVKEVTGLGLKESKDLVDGSSISPTLILEDVPQDKQKEYKTMFEDIGADIAYK